MPEKENKTLKIIQSLLEKQKKEQQELCKYLNVSKSTFSNWKSGNSESYLKKLPEIADYFGVTVNYLLGKEEKTPSYERENNAIFLDNNKIRMIPLFENVSAGFGAMPVNEIIDYIPLYIQSEYEAEDTICIKVQGDSMYPKIENGDIIQVHKQDSVDSGQTAVVLIDGTDAVVKKVTYGVNWIELHSTNPEYKTRRFNGAEVQRIQVLGLVKKVIKNI